MERVIASESAEQQALMDWWNSGGRRQAGLPRQALLFAIPNGGARHPATAARLRREGVLAGVPDLLLAWPAHGKAGLWIEMKRRVGGRVSPEQESVMDALERAGYVCIVARGWLEAAQAIVAYAIPEEEPEPEAPEEARHGR